MIKFGTDGWRAIIADQFTFENVGKVAQATANWILNNSDNHTAVVGYDCRFLGKEFAQKTAQVLAANGIKTVLSSTYATTPSVSLAAVKHKCFAGIVITASHNPHTYNGYKIKAHYGGPANPENIQKVEDEIANAVVPVLKSVQEYEKRGLVNMVDLDGEYCDHVRSHFDLAALESSRFKLCFDSMYGAGQNVMKQLFPLIHFLHSEINPNFGGQAPEPIHKNLLELSQLLGMTEELDWGLATDGDADRLGLYDEDGHFVDSHHILLLLISYLVEHKGMSGKVVNSFSCSNKIGKLCRQLGLEQEVTKIGFKYICDIMVNEDVLVGGEESGGIAIKNHIPERDGIWIGLTIWQYMNVTGKPLKQLIADLYTKIGSFSVQRYDLHLTEALKQNIIQNCKSGAYKSFKQYEVTSVDDLDGFKFMLPNEEWVLIRPSGTEPVLRVYAEASTEAASFSILDATKETILA